MALWWLSSAMFEQPALGGGTRSPSASS